MTWRIGEILIQKKLINWDQLSDALNEQRTSREFVGEILIRKGYVAQPFVYMALAEQYQMRYVDLKRTRLNPRALELVPRSICEKYQIIPIELIQNSLVIAIGNPLTVWPELELKQLTKVEEIRTVLCVPAQIREAVEESYPASRN